MRVGACYDDKSDSDTTRYKHILTVSQFISGQYSRSSIRCDLKNGLLLPVLKAINYDILLFGVVITVNLAIGFCTPPFGINLFVAGAISKESIEAISKQLIWFIMVMILDLMLITYIPQISLCLL